MCIPAIAPMLIGSLAPTAAVGSAAAAGVGFGSLGTILQLGGALVGGLSQMANARASARAATRSAQYADEAAREALESGKQESDLRQRAGAKLMGQNAVAAAANGMDVTSGSALDMLEDTHSSVNQDAFRIRTNAWRESKALSQQAANYRAEAASANSAARFAPIQTVLGAGARVFDRWGQYQAGQIYPGTSNQIMATGYGG